MDGIVSDGGKHIIVKSLTHCRIRKIGRWEPAQQLLHRRNDLTRIHDVTRILLVGDGVVHGNLLCGSWEIALRKVSGSLQRSWHPELIQSLWHSSRFVVVGKKKEEFVSLSIKETRCKK